MDKRTPKALNICQDDLVVGRATIGCSEEKHLPKTSLELLGLCHSLSKLKSKLERDLAGGFRAPLLPE